jgi:hypothetical protein
LVCRDKGTKAISDIYEAELKGKLKAIAEGEMKAELLS